MSYDSPKDGDLMVDETVTARRRVPCNHKYYTQTRVPLHAGREDKPKPKGQFLCSLKGSSLLAVYHERLIMKTNAVRLLDEAGIAYRLAAYDVDEADLSAETVARKIGLPPAQVFKTLAARGDQGGVLLALIAAGTELDLKALAAASGSKRCELLPLKEVQPVTGYIRGGVSPLGAKKRFPIYLDRAALAHAEISLSAGVRGTQILLAPADLVSITQATLGDFHQPNGEETGS